MKYNNILVPTDFSEYSIKGYEFALEVACYHNSFLHLLHVVKPVGSEKDIPYGFGKTEHEIYLDAEEKLRRFASTIPAFGIKIFETVRIGKPDEEILKFTELKNIDLIIIARSNCIGLYKQNSVGDNIIKDSKIPVICVRSDNFLELRKSNRFKAFAENWLG